MRRVVLGLAIVTGSFVAIFTVFRLDSSAGPISAWIVQVSGVIFLQDTFRRIEKAVRTRGLPAWVVAQADRNRRRALPMAVSAMMLALLAAIVPGRTNPDWRLGLVSLAIGFNLGAIAVGLVSIAGQTRLLRAASR